MLRRLVLSAVLVFCSSSLAQVERPDFVFFSAPNLYFKEPTVGTINIGNGPFTPVLKWLINNTFGFPVTSEGDNVPLSSLLGHVCAVHEGRVIGQLVCPISSLYRRALSIVNSLGVRASSLGNSIINDFLKELGNAVQDQLSNFVVNKLGWETVNNISISLRQVEDWLVEKVSDIEQTIRKRAYHTGKSFIARIFPSSNLYQGITNKEDAIERLPDLVSTLQVSNLPVIQQEEATEQQRTELKRQVEEVIHQAGTQVQASQKISSVNSDLSVKAEAVAKSSNEAVTSQPSVRGVLVELSKLQADALRLQLTSDDRLVKLAKEQILTQAATNQILAAQVKIQIQREMRALNELKGQGRAAAEKYLQEIMETINALEGLYEMPASLSERQAVMSEAY